MSKKRRKILFIDGYNIINDWEVLREFKEESLELARAELIEILDEYSKISEEKIILVYDGHLIKGNAGEVSEYKDILIVFTKENETADSYIEREVMNMPYGFKVRVASSDLMEQNLIFGKGAQRVSARELAVEIENTKAATKRLYKRRNVYNDVRISGLDDEEIKRLEAFKNKL